MLKHIFNQTLSMGCHTRRFKTAIIKLIPKANTNPTNPINHRPISLLEVFFFFFLLLPFRSRHSGSLFYIALGLVRIPLSHPEFAYLPSQHP